MYRASWFKYCTLVVASVGAVVCTKVEGGGAGFVRESSIGRRSTAGKVLVYRSECSIGDCLNQ